MAGALERIEAERAIAQLAERTGRMAELGSEDGAGRLDWVMGAASLLANEVWLEEVEREADALWEGGTRHIIWSGMGGSVMAVRVLLELGLGGHGPESIALYPLDSTDPAALEAVLAKLAGAKGLPLPAEGSSASTAWRALCEDVTMIGVSMGMTSEEPITHLEWFAGLLEQSGLPLARHALVMTLPGSYLERFARGRGIPTRPLQLDGGAGTGGRMSAPTTRVFLLPVALALRSRGREEGRLRAMLRAAWAQHDLAGALQRPGDHPYVRLAAIMSDAAIEGVCRLFVEPEGAAPLIPWIEQLMEESLGKGGKGVVVFEAALLDPAGRCYRDAGAVYVRHGEPGGSDGSIVTLPALAGGEPAGPPSPAALAAAFLGWQLCMALYGYLHDIRFAGQPAVEDYKARARALRDGGDPLGQARRWGTELPGRGFTLLAPSRVEPARGAADVVAAALRRGCPPYLDLTINGEADPAALATLRRELERLGQSVLGVPLKLRRAPAAYHSTEQSEMDGPPGVVSLRVLAGETEPVPLGAYDATFLAAQAVGSWQAMVEVGRTCFLLLLDSPLAAGVPDLTAFLEQVSNLLQTAEDRS